MLNKRIALKMFYFVTVLSIILGCSSCYYTVPGKGANMLLFEGKPVAPPTADQPQNEQYSDAEMVEREPAASFPAKIVVVRVQQPNYKSETLEVVGGGAYSVITAQDIEKNKDFVRLGKLPDITQIAPLKKMLKNRWFKPDRQIRRTEIHFDYLSLFDKFQSDRELRSVAAQLRTDMLLIYTVDTTFLDVNASAPLSVIHYGPFRPEVNVRIITIVSGIVMDTRTGFIYGAVKGTAYDGFSVTRGINATWEQTQQSSPFGWERKRLRAERKTFEQLLDEFETLWPNIVKEYKK